MSVISPTGLNGSVAPEVSIVILNFNKSDLTTICLRNIWTNTTGRSYEVIVVDNGSNPHDFCKLDAIHGDFRLIQLPVNRYFGEGNNIGVEHSRGKYIIFLNNDAFVTANWLEPLIDTLERAPLAGGAGPQFFYPKGRLQEAGGFFQRNGHVVQRGKFYPMEAVELDHQTIVDYCSAACFAMRRETFDRIGGYDATFEPVYYEDADLCMKIACLDLFVYYVPQSRVFHIENATTAEYGPKFGFNRSSEINRLKFLARWGEYLDAREHDHKTPLPPLPAIRPRTAAPAGAAAPIAVFYMPYALIPGGGERYILTAAAALVASHRVYIATESPYSEYRLDYLARELSLDLSGISLTTIRQIARLGAIDIFVHLGNHHLPLLPPQGRRNVHVCQFPFPTDDHYVARMWSNLKGYDCIVVYSAFVEGVLQTRLNAFLHDVNVQIVPPPVPIPAASAIPKVRGETNKLRVISIGRFFIGGHNKRHDVLIKAVRRMSELGIEVELDLVGSLHPDSVHIDHYNRLLRQAEGLPIRFHTNATPQVVQKLLQGADIYWHAAGFEVDPRLYPDRCEHFGISVVEAMAFGCVPFVVANGGPAQIVHNNESGFHYRTIDELVAKTQALQSDPAQMRAVSERAQQEALQYEEAVFTAQWRKLATASVAQQCYGKLRGGLSDDGQAPTAGGQS